MAVERSWEMMREGREEGDGDVVVAAIVGVDGSGSVVMLVLVVGCCVFETMEGSVSVWVVMILRVVL